MDKIIVTVSEEKNRFVEDLELPSDLIVEKLKDDIAQTLNGYRPELFLNSCRIKIQSPRHRRMLKDNETLEEAGIWNGDYLVLTEG